MSCLKIAVLTAVLSILLIGSAAAQGLLVEPSIGIKAGVNSSTLQVSGTGTSPRTGFTGGAYFKLPLGQMTLQIEALYSQKGFTKSSYEGITGWEFKTDYFEVPVTLNVDIPMGSTNPYFYGGFSPGVKLSADEKSSATNGEWIDTGDTLKGSNVTFVFGVGLRYKRVFIDARFNHGMTELSKDADVQSIKDRTFSFTAGYAIWR